MGSFQREPVMPEETHVGYIEGYLDALEKVLDVQRRHSTMSLEDICSTLRMSMRTFVVAGEQVTLPQNLVSFPSTEQLLVGTQGTRAND